MNTENEAIPEVLRELNLTPRQAMGVQVYIGRLLRYATKQLHMMIGLALIVSSAVIVVALSSDVSQSLPFESLAEVAMRYVTLAGAAVGVLSIVVFEVAISQQHRLIGRALELTPAQTEAVRALGEGAVRYVLFGWIGRLAARLGGNKTRSGKK